MTEESLTYHELWGKLKNKFKEEALKNNTKAFNDACVWALQVMCSYESSMVEQESDLEVEYELSKQYLKECEEAMEREVIAEYRKVMSDETMTMARKSYVFNIVMDIFKIAQL